MRSPIQKVVRTIAAPSSASRFEAQKHGGSRAAHDKYMTWESFNTIEQRQPPVALTPPETITVAAWNLERCKCVEQSAELIQHHGVDVVLATELDWGMARSSQRHTTRELAELLGFGYVFGVEFVELGTGDSYETEHFSDVPNEVGIHGNAILSRFPLSDASLIPIEEEGGWYVRSPKNDGQLRLGGRMAMAAKLGSVTFVAVHYESESNAHGRARQTECLLSSVGKTYGSGATVLGGDLNTRAFSDERLDRATVLAETSRVEPAFEYFENHGFEWRSVNTGAPTTRALPHRQARYPLGVLDWLLVRGVAASSPRVVPALSTRADYLSDHEMIVARINIGAAS